MAAEKPKQKRRGFRPNRFKKVTFHYRTTPAPKPIITEALSREIGKELLRGRTRAQTARNIGRELTSNSEKANGPLFTCSGKRPGMIPVSRNMGAKANTRGKTLGYLSTSENAEDTLILDTQALPTVLADSDPAGPEEEKEEFFMAPEDAATGVDNPHELNGENGNIGASNISNILANINTKLLKLDTLDSLNTKLEDNLSSLQSKVEGMVNTVNAVKSDLARYERRWEDTVNSLTDRITELENSSQSWEKRWELQREALKSDCKILQTSIDSNSKNILELSSTSERYKQQWDSLHELEEKTKKAADKKFQEVQKMLRDDLRKELLQEIKMIKPSEVTQEDLS